MKLNYKSNRYLTQAVIFARIKTRMYSDMKTKKEKGFPRYYKYIDIQQAISIELHAEPWIQGSLRPIKTNIGDYKWAPLLLLQ